LAVAIAALLLSSVAAPFAASAQNAPIERETASDPYAVHVADAARRFGIPEAWIWAVMRIESNGDARAVSTAGAMGLMQIMPRTWATLRARYRLGSDPFNAHDNIMAGAAYLREMHDRYGDVTAMLAAYNAGPGRYNEHLSRGRLLPGETLAYLAKLAPITGGAGDTQLAAAPAPDPFAWRRAALFAARSATPSTVQPDTANDAADARAERPLTDGEGVAVATITPLSAGLFIPVSRRSPQ
jgi:soluble lytic murein transglycosylase-like protein